MRCFTYYTQVIKALFLLFSFDTSFVSGFSTQKCSHEQIETHLKSILNCRVKSQSKFNINDAFFKQATDQTAGIEQNGTKIIDWCELIDEDISCFIDNIGTCFDQKISNDFAIIMEWTYNKQPYIECNRIKGLTKDEIKRKAMAIVAHYNEDVQRLQSIVTFDKECSTEELIDSVRGQFPCFQKQFVSIMVDLTLQMQMPPHQTPVPVCKHVIEIFSTCFQETQCLSQPEMNLIRDVLAIHYNITMSFIVQLSAQYGGVSKFVDVIRAAVDDKLDIGRNTKQQWQSVSMMGDLILEDYKSDSCQQSLKQFTMGEDDGIESYVIILVLSLVVIILIAVLGWVFYAWSYPTTRSGQILIRSTSKYRVFRSTLTSTV